MLSMERRASRQQACIRMNKAGGFILHEDGFLLKLLQGKTAEVDDNPAS